MKTKLISNGLWFDSQAEEAAKFYTSIFPQSKVNDILRYGKEGFEIHKRPENSVMLVEFDLAGEKSEERPDVLRHERKIIIQLMSTDLELTCCCARYVLDVFREVIERYFFIILAMVKKD